MGEPLITKNILIVVYLAIVKALRLKAYGPLHKNQTMEMVKIVEGLYSTSVGKIVILPEKKMHVWNQTVFL